MKILIQNSPEWHAWRRGKIGASYAPIIMGVSRFSGRRELWEAMTGRITRGDSKNFIQGKGLDLEEKARNNYQLETFCAWTPTIAELESEPKIIASLDGYNKEKSAILEIKYLGLESYNILKNENKIPEEYYPQLMHQSYVTGCTEIHFLGVIDNHIKKEIPPGEIEYHVSILRLTVEDQNYILKKLIPALIKFLICVEEDRPPEISDKDFLVVKDKEIIEITDALNEELKKIKELKMSTDVKKAKIKIYALRNHDKLTCGKYKCHYQQARRVNNQGDSKMLIEKLVTTGRNQKPIAMLLHAEHGVGKTTFGTTCPNPIFIAGEEIEEVECPKFPKCVCWNDFVGYLGAVRDESHDYKTLVIDTLDSIEEMLWKHVMVESGAQSIETSCGGYGKGYIVGAELFKKVRDEYLVPIRDKRNMNIVLLCHTVRTQAEDPIEMIPSYIYFEPKLHTRKSGISNRAVWTEWVTLIAFARTISHKTTQQGQNNKSFLVGEGKPVMHCKKRPHYVAKNRYADVMPEAIELDWNILESHVQKFWKTVEDPEVEGLKKEINILINKIKDEALKRKTKINIKAVGNDLARLEKAKTYIENVVGGIEKTKGAEND